MLANSRSDGYTMIPRAWRAALDPLYHRQVNPSQFFSSVFVSMMEKSTVSCIYNSLVDTFNTTSLPVSMSLAPLMYSLSKTSQYFLVERERGGYIYDGLGFVPYPPYLLRLVVYSTCRNSIFQ